VHVGLDEYLRVDFELHSPFCVVTVKFAVDEANSKQQLINRRPKLMNTGMVVIRAILDKLLLN
jgi:hypothetical protein